MKILLFFLLPLVGFGQAKISLLEKRNDSLGVVNMHLSFRTYKVMDYVQTFRPTDRIKVTFKTSMNRNLIGRNVDRLINGGEVGSQDIMSLAAYDMRIKYYLDRRHSILLRVFATGIKSESYFYSVGYISKF
jgi:hypothetical protein